MRNHVTIIPIDSMISVDGVPLTFSFSAPATMHALQWHSGSGHIEFTDGTPNRDLQAADYTSEVEPFVLLWENEKARLDEIANRPLTFEEEREFAFAALTHRRWEVETGGIVISGMPIPTDRESQALITGAVAGALIDPAQVIYWKTSAKDEHGVPISVPLDATTLKAVALAVRAHVQACFDLEAAKGAELAALTNVGAIQTWLVTALNTGWPGAESGV